MSFKSEADFETALIDVLKQKGWERAVLHAPSEQDLLDNWARILFDNNRGADRLNDVPLTAGEMQQIIEQIRTLKTPFRLNGFINGKTVSIKRDNPLDALHLGKEVSLKIYDRHEIAAGQSRYQIARQPRFARPDALMRDRRGDVMLLINGMPVFHLELKRSGVPVSQACNQIRKYAEGGLFGGLFALVQIFVAMTPEETLYFANPGGHFNPDYYFHWADVNNEPLNDWRRIAADFLSIPMAHQLIGFYMVADDSDGVLKVMRSYQYYAAHAITDRVAKLNWKQQAEQRGGYIWHTTGSGKTMTSFKAAQLIANAKDADKVVFLMDRIELGTQSLAEYRHFADEGEAVQATESARVLLEKLKSADPANTLLVTSIQKMSNIGKEGQMQAADVAAIAAKRLVIIVDECHRSTFGEMLRDIKDTFPGAVFFGFTGTPVFDENQRKHNTTVDVFGDELHRYSIADGIRDRNVLGFDVYQVNTFKDKDLRRAVALEQARASDESQVWGHAEKEKVFRHFMDAKKVPMAGFADAGGQYHKGIEDYAPGGQWQTPEHCHMVLQDVLGNFGTLSQGGRFHAIFATSSIAEAIGYYRLFKAQAPGMAITALFDPNEGNEATSAFKEQALAEIMGDYNARYGKNFDIGRHASFKKDVADRLAHKGNYKRVQAQPDERLDLLIVVDQMLTGYDSRWVNTLYLDKLIRYEHLIQAFSRTNRLFGHEKPFGVIRYYRKPHTMHSHVQKAVQLYSGNRPVALFVDKLPRNVARMNALFADMQRLFADAGVQGFAQLPPDAAACARFAKLFNQFSAVLQAARVQGFDWAQRSYGQGKEKTAMQCDEQTWLVLLLRYQELGQGGDGTGDGASADVPFDLQGHLSELNTDRIDHDYLNSRFEKYLKALGEPGNSEAARQALDALHQAFPSLNAQQQKYANVLLRDIQRGDLQVEPGKTFKDYIAQYQSQARDSAVREFAQRFGLDEALLRRLLSLGLCERNLDEFGRFDQLKQSANKARAKAFFEAQEGKPVPPPLVHVKLDKALRAFLLADAPR